MIHSDIPKSPQTIDWHGFKHSCAKMIKKIYFGEERKRHEKKDNQATVCVEDLQPGCMDDFGDPPLLTSYGKFCVCTCVNHTKMIHFLSLQESESFLSLLL